MQKFTIATVTPGTKEESPVVITATDSTKMSGFDKKLADLLPGAVIEVDLAVKGKYNNIVKWAVVQEGRNPAPAAGGHPLYTNEQIAILGAVSLISNDKVEKESALGKKVANWLLANIPADQFDPAGVKAISKPVHVSHTEEHKAPAAPEVFVNAGQLLTWAFTTYKLNSTSVSEIPGVKDAMQRADFAEAKKKIIESQTGK